MPRRVLILILSTLIAAYGLACLLAFVFQARLLYLPNPNVPALPTGARVDVRAVELSASDGVRIRAWYLPADPVDAVDPVESGAEAPEALGALVFCHGNAGNIGDRLEPARAFQRMGLSVLLFDYRGYGGSQGTPSEEGTYLDAEAAFEYLVETEGFEPTRVAVYGESLGTAVATELVARRGAACLVLESAFTSIPDIGARVYPWLPVRWLARIRYDTAAKIGGIDAPILFVQSPADELIPFEHGRRLFELARDAEWLSTDGGHNGGGFMRRAEWIARVERFLADALAR